jgi:hypothetical protein
MKRLKEFLQCVEEFNVGGVSDLSHDGDAGSWRTDANFVAVIRRMKAMSHSLIRFDRLFVQTIVTAAFAVGAVGCGAGSKVVTNVAFTDQVIGGDLYAGIDATLAPGSIALPAATLPLYNPKNPSQLLGHIETNGLHIIVDVNTSAALKLPDLVDGSKLPSGAAIPLVLPAGLVPIGIPAFNSNSKVYVAINGTQILVGVAVTLAQDTNLNLPLSLFLPFTISQQISGTAGFFLGSKQGVAVFAMKNATTAPMLPTITTIGVKTLAGAKAARALPAMVGLIEAKSEPITSETLQKFEDARDEMWDVAID